ncbi:hypothetical protein NMD86_08250 [Edwardsiella tarda]|uniref:hypothetical protein n=1 Tax=Edwardsiella tarda TaxID=636 RepID=UPI00351C6F27
MNGSNDLMEYPISQVKRVLYREASNVRHYENLKFLLSCYKDIGDAEVALNAWYSGKAFSLPPIKLKIYSLGMSDAYSNKYGTTNFDVFSVYLMNLCSLLGIQKFLNSGNSYEDIKRRPDAVKKYVFGERDDWLPKSVKVWRNKVAAHYAAADPQRSDNLITLMDSLSIMPSYSYPRYIVSSMVISIGGEMSQIKEWSVTRVYDELVEKLSLPPLTPLLISHIGKINGEKEPIFNIV